MFTFPKRPVKHDPQRMVPLEYAVILLGILYIAAICAVAADFQAMEKRITRLEASHGSP